MLRVGLSLSLRLLEKRPILLKERKVGLRYCLLGAVCSCSQRLLSIRGCSIVLGSRLRLNLLLLLLLLFLGKVDLCWIRQVQTRRQVCGTIRTHQRIHAIAIGAKLRKIELSVGILGKSKAHQAWRQTGLCSSLNAASHVSGNIGIRGSNSVVFVVIP